MKANRIVVAGMAALMGTALGGCVVEDGGGYQDFRGPPPRYDHDRRDDRNRDDRSDRRDWYGDHANGDRRDDGRYDNGGRDHDRSDRHGDRGFDRQGRDNNDHRDQNGSDGGDHHDRDGCWRLAGPARGKAGRQQAGREELFAGRLLPVPPAGGLRGAERTGSSNRARRGGGVWRPV